MPALSELDKSRTRYHLAYNCGTVPAGDYARLEEAMTTLESNYWVEKVKAQLDRCDRAEALSELGETGFSTKELITGDINRSIIRTSNNDGIRVWRENYLFECDRLAQTLYVPNYRDESQMRYRFERPGTSFIKALPGPADTCVGDRQYLAATFV